MREVSMFTGPSVTSSLPAVCFACDRPLGRSPRLVDTRDDQTVFVGRTCATKIRAAGDAGWQPPRGGPRLYLLNEAAYLVERALALFTTRSVDPEAAPAIEQWFRRYADAMTPSYCLCLASGRVVPMLRSRPHPSPLADLARLARGIFTNTPTRADAWHDVSVWLTVYDAAAPRLDA